MTDQVSTIDDMSIIAVPHGDKFIQTIVAKKCCTPGHILNALLLVLVNLNTPD